MRVGRGGGPRGSDGWRGADGTDGVEDEGGWPSVWCLGGWEGGGGSEERGGGAVCTVKLGVLCERKVVHVGSDGFWEGRKVVHVWSG